jgi:dinuclear metal center YbgI/SA1388 family protein
MNFSVILQSGIICLKREEGVCVTIMLINEIIAIIESVLPSSSAMDGDRVGLQLQSGNEEVRSALFAFETTDETIAEADKLGVDCIICFHPLIYSPIVQISENERVGKLVTKLIKKSISLIVAHTNFDAFHYGTSRLLADRLGLRSLDFLVRDNKIENAGMGIIAEAGKPIYKSDLLASVKSVCESPIRHNAYFEDKQIKKIAILGGSGFSFYKYALANKCDAFITADCSYHKFHEVEDKLLLIDPGHYEMEKFVPEGMSDALAERLQAGRVKTFVSKTLTNPVFYY